MARVRALIDGRWHPALAPTDPLVERLRRAPTRYRDWITAGGAPHDCLRLSYDGGDRLFIASAKMGYATHLGAAELAALARRDQAFYTGLLDTPLGPESDSPVWPAH